MVGDPSGLGPATAALPLREGAAVTTASRAAGKPRAGTMRAARMARDEGITEQSVPDHASADIPMGRLGTAQEVAAAVAFPASPLGPRTRVRIRRWMGG